jgi:flagellar hook-associated protein 3 FlgL
MRVSTSQFFRQSTSGILEQQASLVRTGQQVASGRRILAPADDPTGAKRLLDLEQSLELTAQFVTNGKIATNRLGLEDGALDAAGNILQRVREIAVQANNSTLTAPDRQALAREVGVRLDELLGVANTKDGNNEYIFAGVSSQARPFAANGAGGFVYNGDQTRREIQIGPDYRVAMGDDGSSVFLQPRNGNATFATGQGGANTGTGIIDDGALLDPALWVPDSYSITMTSATAYEVRDGAAALVTTGTFSSGAAISFAGIQVGITGQPAAGDSFSVDPSVRQGMFTTVQDLESALNASQVTPAEQAAFNNAMNRSIADIDQALERLLAVRADVGARLVAVENEQQANEGFEIHLQTLRSEIEDLDLAEAISRLTQQSTALEAAQASFVRIQDLSLFRFL